jgi:hypothetical protein
MRSRYALLIAVAFVFAPGWYGNDVPKHARGSDLAARVLAPTVNDGAVLTPSVDVKYHLRAGYEKRGPAVTSMVGVSLAFDAIAFVLFWLILSYRGSLRLLVGIRFRFSRAPPLLQLA